MAASATWRTRWIWFEGRSGSSPSTARVSVCVTGHWLIGHFAHRRGPQTWVIEGAAAQGHNVPLAGLISMGESWHNNHHAFPASARLGLFPGQIDLGWWLIAASERLGLAWDIKTPDNLPQRQGLRRVATEGEHPSAALDLGPELR